MAVRTIGSKMSSQLNFRAVHTDSKPLPNHFWCTNGDFADFADWMNEILNSLQTDLVYETASALKKHEGKCVIESAGCMTSL